jgi:MraZ protein
MLLTGTYERALDEKLRLALPKRFRELLAGQPEGSDGNGQLLFLTPGTDGSLALFAGPAFARMAEKLAAQSPTAQDVRAFGRLLYAQSQSVELDGQGRFRVPPELLRLAGLGRECVLIGVGDHIELWDKARWQAYLENQQPRYDQLAESALGGVAPLPARSHKDVAGVTDDTVIRPGQPR